MKKLISILFILSISFAQQTWTKTYGGLNDDWGYSVRQSSDGGYIVTGYTDSFGAGAADVYLIKTDSTGDTLWTRTYGGTNDDDSRSVQQTQDGGYIITGTTKSFGVGNRDLWLIRTNASGDTLWTRTYGGSDDDWGYFVRQTSDGGYIVTGYTYSFGAGAADVYLIKTDSTGDTLWTRTYGGSGNDEGFSVQQTSDGGYIIAGYTGSFGAGYEDVYLVKTDSLGDTLWTKTYGGPSYDEGCFVQQTSDGGYVVAGYTDSFGAGIRDVYLVKTDSLGDTLWTKTYGGVYYDVGCSVQQTSDGGYVVVGTTMSFGSVAYNVYLIKTNAFGDTLWTKTYGGVSYDEGCFVQQALDGGYIVAGKTSSFGAGNNDVYLIKTDANGNAEVEEEKSSAPKIEVRLKAIPNPFTTFARIPGYEKEDFALSDISGRMVGKYKGAKIGDKLSAGVYFVIPQNKNIIPLRIVKIK